MMGKIFLVLLLAFGILCLEGLIAMALWNWILVGLFALPRITFWFGVGICLLGNFITAFIRG